MTITVLVKSPRTDATTPMDFPDEVLVLQAARWAMQVLGYQRTPYVSFKRQDGTVFDRNQTLRTSGINHGDTVEVVEYAGPLSKEEQEVLSMPNRHERRKLTVEQRRWRTLPQRKRL